MKKKTIIILSCTIFLLLVPSVSAFSIYDVNQDEEVNVQDATECWANRGGTDMIYDVNSDGIINVQDATEIWSHRGDQSSVPELIFEWLTEIIWGS